MPGRNTVKEYAGNSYYHLYNRGVNKEAVFVDDQDYIVFLGLLKRYLGEYIEKKQNRTNQPNFYDDLELLAYCLMRNHFHLFIFQYEDPNAIVRFMKSLGTSYGMYFNKRYKRVGPVFQQRYRAVRITSESQYEHISRYIHMNPKNYLTYKWSSLPYYTGKKSADWVKPDKIINEFPSSRKYIKYLEEYENRRDEINAFKSELANG